MKMPTPKKTKKPSEIFEGENSSLRRTFDSVTTPPDTTEGWVEETPERFCRKHYFLVDLEERRKTPCPICGCMITFQELKKKAK